MHNESGTAGDPIAVVGIGCRFPGDANDAAGFWRLLADGVDAITDIPPDRFDVRLFCHPGAGHPGKITTRRGGFVKGIERFDSGFFGISPREAASMDPQQRMLLEVAWEAIEDAGMRLEELAGSPVGVFVGISTFDYAAIQASHRDRASADVYVNTGSAFSIAANRISYCLNLKGPSAAVDTACSSALFAVHLACRSLWQKESSVALAGGVSALVSPGPYLGFSRLAMLSPDGCCKAFDARANGFVRSEGAGVVVLKPLSRALADGDLIYSLIRGTAANQDGRTPGLTVPNQQSQESVVKEALRQAGVRPAEVQFVEAHGTGTAVGDPVEAKALGSVLTEGRPEGSTCAIGSVKTNLGHLEAAAGMAGLIKATLAVHHRMIPANLHFQSPNPEIPLERLRLRVPQQLEPWPETSLPAFAGVNSFGFGGTNVHVVLQEPPQPNGVCPSPDTPDSEQARLLPLSARSPEALRALARSYQEFLSTEAGRAASLRDFGHTLCFRRTHHDHRLAIVTRGKAELAEQLAAFAAGQADANLVADRAASGQPPKLAFVFSGQGPQWWAMGRQLLDCEPVFRDVIHRCDELVRGLGPWSLLEELSADESSCRLHETAVAQPAIFAIQAALAALWASWGVRPDAVVGHSVGEVAAGYVAGVLTLEEAVRVIYQRGRCMDQTPLRGRMLAVGLPAEETLRMLAGCGDRLGIAAVNSPNSVTVSGDAAPLEDFARLLEQKNVFQRFLRIDYAFHSFHMEPIREELLASLAGLQPRPAAIPLYSTVTGQRVEGPEWTADYWWQNVRQTVRFAEAVDRLIESEHSVVLEVSPHPVLASAVSECFLHRGKKVKILPSLRRKEDERVSMLRSLGALYALGRPVDWGRLVAQDGRFVRLPAYPWQRESYWQESEESRQSRLGKPGHPLLGSRQKTPYPSWESNLNLELLPYLEDHRVQGHVLFPATGYLEMGLAVAKETFGAGAYVLEDLKLVKACFLAQGSTRIAQTVFQPEDCAFQIYTRAEDAGAWEMHAGGVARSLQDGGRPRQVSLDEIRSRCPQEFLGKDCYPALRTIGLEYGRAFACVERVWLGEGECLSQIRLPDELAGQVQDYHCHPATMDAAFQMLLGSCVASRRSGARRLRELYLPVEIEQIRVYDRLGPTVWSHASITQWDRQGVVGQVRVFDEQGRLLVEGRGIRCQRVGAEGAAGQTLDDLLYEARWQFQPRRGQDQARRRFQRLGPLDEIAEAVRAEAEPLLARLRMQRYDQLEQQLNGLSVAYIWSAFEELGGNLQAEQRFCADALAERLKVAGQHRRLLGRYLEILAEEGILHRTDEGWEVVRAPVLGKPQETWRQILRQNPASFAELTLIARCGDHLAAILRGELNPLQVIFPDGSLAMSEHFYTDSPPMRSCNTLAAKSLAKVVENLPPGRTLRVLEIGAGTGGLTSYALPVLPADRTEYVFTDLSNHFFNKAGQKFADYPFVQYQRLDIEKNPIEQGFAEHSFDLILASLALHATADLRQTLAHVRQLLASEGVALLLESVTPPRWGDIVFGTMEGWWRFADLELRPSHPLAPFPTWKRVLEEMGFGEVTDVAGNQDAQGFGMAVILARGPGIEQETDHAEPAAAQPEDKATWLIFADRGGVGDRLARRLRSRGQRCAAIFAADACRRNGDDHVEADPENLQSVKQAVRRALADGPPSCQGIVYLWGLDAPRSDGLSPDQLEAFQTANCLGLVHLLQAWAEAAAGASPRLSVVTRAAQSVGERPEPVSLPQTPLLGLGRVVFNEYPQLAAKRIDLGSEASEIELASLVEELTAPDDEEEIALRGEARYVYRYMPRPLDVRRPGVRQDAREADAAFRLEISRFGTLDGLTLQAAPRRPPGPGEVEIRVLASALNFSDVMKALGLYPGLPDGPVPLGTECAGTIAAVGEGVGEFQVGDEVVAVAPFSFANYALTRAAFVAKKPEQITFEEAATIPIAFLTASYALRHVGRLDRGERVLIHSATGGVGLAAVQLAQNLQAEVFATAGSAEKRDFLRLLGIEHVMNSRGLAFADEVLEQTAGDGVDVVLNSLAGEAIPKGLSILREYGRFLEIGKRDIYQNSRVGLRPFRKNASFAAIDLDRVIRQRPELAASLFRQVVDEVRDGRLAPLPHRVFSIANVVAAFRYMAQARHIGKVVISLDQQAPVAHHEPKPVAFRADATYLITGGLGGFGLLVARWMADRGARNLVLAGRRGVQLPEQGQAVEALRKAGAQVLVAQVDVSSPDQVADLLAQAGQSMPPLRGIVHAAMVLEDHLVHNLDRERLRRVLGPKATGAWNLHSQTLDQPLDFFVCFSSIAGVFGSLGQANYAAGNAFLDGLAWYRRALGRPGLTVNWGQLGEVGYVARNAKVSQLLNSQGLLSFSPDEALSVLGRLMQQDTIQAGVARLDWSRWRSGGANSSVSPRFAHLVKMAQVDAEASQQDGVGLHKALQAAPPAERRELLLGFLRQKVARVLGSSASKVDLDKPLTDLGLDSLMAVELRNWIEGELRVNLPIVELMHGPTVAKLADLLLAQWDKTEAPAAPAAPAPVAAEEALPVISEGSENLGSGGPGESCLTLACGADRVPVRLLAPQAVADNSPLPVVVALHGAGGSEDTFFEGYGDGKIVPLCRTRGWLLVCPRGSVFGLEKLMDQVLAEVGRLYPVDQGRVLLLGHSMGAIQAIACAQNLRQPPLAVAALAGGGKVEREGAWRETAFFVAVGSEDPSRAGTRRLSRALKAAGAGSLHYREYPNIDHGGIVSAALDEVFAFFDRALHAAPSPAC